MSGTTARVGAAVLAALVLLGIGALLGGWRPFSSEPGVLTFGPGGDLAAFTLFDGQCGTGALAGGGTFDARADTPCGEPHDIEVVASRAPLDESRAVAYPGEGALADFGRAFCALVLDSATVAGSAGGVDKGDLDVTAVVPTEAAFLSPSTSDAGPTGSRQVAGVVSRSDGEKLTDRFSVV